MGAGLSGFSRAFFGALALCMTFSVSRAQVPDLNDTRDRLFGLLGGYGLEVGSDLKSHSERLSVAIHEFQMEFREILSDGRVDDAERAVMSEYLDPVYLNLDTLTKTAIDPLRMAGGSLGPSRLGSLAQDLIEICFGPLAMESEMARRTLAELVADHLERKPLGEHLTPRQSYFLARFFFDNFWSRKVPLLANFTLFLGGSQSLAHSLGLTQVMQPDFVIFGSLAFLYLEALVTTRDIQRGWALATRSRQKIQEWLSPMPPCEGLFGAHKK